MQASTTQAASLFRRAAVATAAVGAVIIAAAAALAGVGGVVGAGLGVAVVVGFFGLTLAVAQLAEEAAPGLALVTVLLSYVTKVTVLAAVLVAFQDTTLFSTTALGVAIGGCAAAWLAVEVRYVWQVPPRS